MRTVYDRIEEEAEELSEKLRKLNAFRASNEFQKLSKVQQALLMSQADAMLSYLRVLRRRIIFWND